MKKIFTSFAILLTLFTYAQNVGINSTGAAPNTSAMLDVDAAPGNDKGLLIPRVALLATNNALPITTPANSLVVYNTATAGTSPNNVFPGFYYWNGTKWIAFGGTGGTDWSLTGNAGTVAGTNFLGTTDATDFTIFTNNTETMRVLSNGNVGIGTTTPASKLDVEGSISVGATYSGTIAAPANGAIIEGNVGIGTPTPISALDIVGTANISDGASKVASIIGNINVNGGGTRTLRFANGTSANTEGFQFWNANSNTSLMMIQNGGNVGIGTTVPEGALDVGGNNEVTVQINPAGSNRYGIRMKHGSNDAFSLFHDDGDGSLNIGYSSLTNDISTHNKYLTVTLGGNVGIGTTSTAEKLDVVGSIRASIAPVKSGTSNPYGLYMYTDNSFTTYIDALTSSTFGVNMHLRTYLNGTYNTILFGDQFGNVGIGTTNPVCKLQVFSANTGVGQANQGGLLFQVQDGSSRPAIAAFGNIDGILPNGTGCAIAVRETTGTGRSINAAGTINASGADYAEYFYQDAPGSLQKGDVVCLAANGKVKKSSKTEQVIGVVSTKAGVVGNDIFDQKNPDKTVLVGLMGQVPVNTTTENGTIQTGDYLTPSATKPGYAMKSTQAENIIGIALEPLTTGEKKIMVYINVGEGNVVSSIKEQAVTIKNLGTQMDELKTGNKKQLELLQKEIEELKSRK